MADSKTLTGLFRLGEAIANEVGSGEGVDTLGRWLSHHLASRLEEAKENPEKESECVDLILRLWAHRASYPAGRRPLSNYDELIATLNKLREQSPYYLPSYDQTDENKKGNEWAKLAVAVDKAARRLIGFSLKQAVRESQLPEDPWLSLAKDIAPDSHVQLLIQFSQMDDEALPETDEIVEEEAEASVEIEFKNDLEFMIELAKEVAKILAEQNSNPP